MTKGLLKRKQVTELTSLSPSTIDRYEAAGQFPQRVVLSRYADGRPARVAWPHDLVLTWISEQTR